MVDITDLLAKNITKKERILIFANEVKVQVRQLTIGKDELYIIEKIDRYISENKLYPSIRWGLYLLKKYKHHSFTSLKNISDMFPGTAPIAATSGQAFWKNAMGAVREARKYGFNPNSKKFN